MPAMLRKLGLFFAKIVSPVLVFVGFLFGRISEAKHVPSVAERIAAIQNAVQKLPPDIYRSFLIQAQWGNWGNWNNWNNWNNWANFRNWNNWGNWGNWANY